jgi:hypothetical protein
MPSIVDWREIQGSFPFGLEEVSPWKIWLYHHGAAVVEDTAAVNCHSPHH